MIPDFDGVAITRDMISREYDTMLREFGLRQKMLDEARAKLFRLKRELDEFDRREIANHNSEIANFHAKHGFKTI